MGKTWTRCSTRLIASPPCHARMARCHRSWPQPPRDSGTTVVRSLASHSPLGPEEGWSSKLWYLTWASGGRCGIRTHGDPEATTAFEAAPFVRSGNLPSSTLPEASTAPVSRERQLNDHRSGPTVGRVGGRVGGPGLGQAADGLLEERRLGRAGNRR